MTDKKVEVKKKKVGRPVGSRSKTSLMKAQIMIDEFAIEAIGNIIALAKNDKEALDIMSDVPATIMLQANKTLLDKALANEKDKLGDAKPSDPKAAREGSKVIPLGPRVFSSAKPTE